MEKKQEVAIPVIRRLPRYYRFISGLILQGVERISSKNLSEKMGLTASQIRQDLNCFGGFGQQGYGYNLAALKDEIGKILGLNDKVGTILIGAGNIGRAVGSRMDFEGEGFDIIGIFDNDPNVIGTKIRNNIVLPSSNLNSFCKENNIKAAIVCVSDKSAEMVVNKLISLGIAVFWNFTHYDILLNNPDKKLAVENVHLNDSLMTLRYLAKDIIE